MTNETCSLTVRLGCFRLGLSHQLESELSQHAYNSHLKGSQHHQETCTDIQISFLWWTVAEKLYMVSCRLEDLALELLELLLHADGHANCNLEKKFVH